MQFHTAQGFVWFYLSSVWLFVTAGSILNARYLDNFLEEVSFLLRNICSKSTKIQRALLPLRTVDKILINYYWGKLT